MRHRERDLSTLSVVVTGGARGIGRATVERLARQGARVAVGDLDADLVREVAAPLGSRVVAAGLDVTDRDSWAAFLAATAAVGPVDVLVNNAGIMPLGPVLAEPDELARRIVDVNLHGLILGTKLVVPGMVERGRGHVVNVASAVGRVALAEGATYTASKFAAVGFSEAIRAELAPYGVEVSVVLPTIVRTELAAGVQPTRGVRPVTADDAARVIEATVRRPRAEVWVPRYAQALAKGSQLLPRSVQSVLARAIRADTVLSGADPAVRAAYEERARRG